MCQNDVKISRNVSNPIRVKYVISHVLFNDWTWVLRLQIFYSWCKNHKKKTFLRSMIKWWLLWSIALAFDMRPTLFALRSLLAIIRQPLQHKCWAGSRFIRCPGPLLLVSWWLITSHYKSCSGALGAREGPWGHRQQLRHFVVWILHEQMIVMCCVFLS